jgi:hypothetical protein
MSTRLMAELDDARLVKFDPDEDLLFAWFGGHGVHVYDETGTEVDYWTCGDFSQNSASEADVLASMLNRLRGMDRLREAAADLGADYGRNDASWVFDGNTTDETYRRVLAGIEDGDPVILDQLPSAPLSGEWADSQTPQSLMSELGAHDLEPEEESELCDIFEEAYMVAVEHTVVTTARRMLEGSESDA